MKLVVGLGNPGKKYARTRHNIGFLCLEAFAHTNKLTFKEHKKFKGQVAEYQNTLLLKPSTFMNLSGESVHQVVNFYNIDPEDILVIYDDMDLPTAKLRLRYQGSAGGHNGIKSIINHLHTQTFNRVRFGIDKPTVHETRDYVLSTFHSSEGDQVIESIKTVEAVMQDFIDGDDFKTIMNRYN